MAQVCILVKRSERWLRYVGVKRLDILYFKLYSMKEKNVQVRLSMALEKEYLPAVFVRKRLKDRSQATNYLLLNA